MPEQPALRIAGTPELANTSESDEMYLITVARAVEEGTTGPVPVGAIAETLSLSATSVNEKIKNLANRDLLEYEPYRGVRLTPSGHIIADRVLRTRRLWATFLTNYLGYSPLEADDRACRLEHATAGDVAERLAVFLGDPEADPMGRPIPVPTSSFDPHPATTRLVDVAVGHIAEVVSVGGSERIRLFLGAEGITTGALLIVLGAGASGLLVKAGALVYLDSELAATIHVRTVGPEGALSTQTSGSSC
jgi:DtxR family Mn-dependent transcriptional regulator